METRKYRDKVMMAKSRSNDNTNDNGYSKRRIFDVKTMVVIMTALFGSSGITGLTSYLTDPNIRTQTRVEAIETMVRAHENRIISIVGNDKKSEMRVENYIKSHNEEEELRQLLNDQEFEHIKELLLEIKADVKAIKNGN